MAETFLNILTIIGQQKKAAAEAGGAAVNITHFKVGDSNGTYYTPLETQTDLVHTTYTGSFIDNSGSQIIVNPSALNEVLYKCYIPANIGGFTVRELGLFDAENNLILICKLPAQDKFALDSGLYQPLTFTPKIIYTNPATQAILSPSSQIIATQTYVTEQIQNITQLFDNVSEQVEEGMQEHINDPDAHTPLFAAKSNVGHDHDERYYTETEIDDIINRLFPNYAKPLAILSGNTDVTTGLPNIISKISDTEVSFLIGGIYNPLVITGKDGKKYIITSILNVTLPTAQGTYIFIIDFTNMSLLQDGTYAAIATAVKMAYSANEASPTKTSNIGQEFDCWIEDFYPTHQIINAPNAYQLMDRNTSTSVTFAEGDQSGSWAFIVKSNIGAVAINKVQVEGPGNFGLGGNSIVSIYGSNNGTTWTSLTSVPSNGITEISNTTPYLYYRFHPNINLVGGYSQYSTWLNNINFWYPVSYSGGKISEGYTYPEATLSYTSVIPTMTSNNSGGFVASGSSIYGGDYYKPFDGITGDAYPLFVYGSHDYVLDLQFDSAKDNIAAYDIKHWDNYVVGWRLQLFYGGAWHIVDEQTGKNITTTTRFYFSSTYSGVTKLRFSTVEPRPGGAFGLDLLQLYQTVSSFPQDGDFHTLINKIPYDPKKKISGNWLNREYVKIGEGNKAANGTLGIPRSYAFNRKTYKKISCPSPNTITDITHDLGTTDIKITAYLVNKNSEVGYSPKQKANFMTLSSALPINGFIIKDNNTLTYVSGNQNPVVQQNGSPYYYSQVTPANWDMEITVEANW
jgi:hypothetical protein